MSGGAAAIAAAMAQATKASGVVVKLEETEFMKILDKNRGGIVVMAIGKFYNRGFHYLTSYKGLAFYTKTIQEIIIPNGTDLIIAKNIWMPE
jgi:hypothetical protein